jgi:hypothetical protein
MYQQLRYRRQFLLARAPIFPPEGWASLGLGDLYLYAHPDLEVHSVADRKQRIVLLGSLFDAEEPEKGNADLVGDLLARVNGLNDFLAGAKRYAGNYALLYQSDRDTVIRQDALALREIYYCTGENRIICASQPNLLLPFAKPEIRESTDPDLLDFYRNHLKNSIWIGDETLYEGVRHLLPNHYLDVRRREARRYWPDEPIRRLDLDVAVSRSCAYLQGILQSMAYRHPLMMAVTSGTDSRTILAASRDLRDRIYYFINNHSLGHGHPDITVPRSMFEKIGVPFHIHDVPEDMDEEFKRFYLQNTFFRTERLLTTIYNVYFRNHGEKVNVTATGEIGRNRYGSEPRRLNSYLVAYKLGHKAGCRYVIRQCEKILGELLPVARHFGVNMLTLLYWEQMIGNWGAIVNSESDIAIEEFDPYDSHLLYELFLGVDESDARYDEELCTLFREMIRTMWPELLQWPINPLYTLREKAIRMMGKAGLFGLLKEWKYRMQYARYLNRL